MLDGFRGALDYVFLLYPRLDLLIFWVFVVLRIKEFANRLSIVEALNQVLSLDLKHGMMGLMNFRLEATVADVSIEFVQTFPTNSYNFWFAVRAFDVFVDSCIHLLFDFWDCYSLSLSFYFCWLWLFLGLIFSWLVVCLNCFLKNSFCFILTRVIQVFCDFFWQNLSIAELGLLKIALVHKIFIW